MTTPLPQEICPAERFLKELSGKWKPQIFRLATEKPLRFSGLLRELPNANKQSVSVALRELEEAELLIKNVMSEKPLHIEYVLSERGLAMVGLFKQMEIHFDEK